MKVAVIGADGFIGTNLVKYLGKIHDLEPLPIVFRNQPDSLFFDEFLSQSKKVDVIIFAGGNSNHYVTNETIYKVIEMDSKYILQTIEHVENKLSILISSAAVYYGYKGVVDENTCAKPSVNYGISKRTAELLFEKSIRDKKSKGIVLRLTHAYGLGERSTRLFSKIVNCLKQGTELIVYGKGESYINPVPVEFLAHVIARLIQDSPTSEIDYYNVGSYEPVKVRDIVEEVHKRFGLKYLFEGEETQLVEFITSTEKLRQRGIFLENAIEVYLNHVQKSLL
mgnify:CR=1 FL=1